MSMRQLEKQKHDSTTTSLPSNLRMLRTEGASLQKLLKEELRMTIMAKRHARGQGELKVDFPEPKAQQLSVAELERRERRREQNRRAAQRCRRKKRMNQLSVIQNYEWIVTRNQQLEQELDRLRQEKDTVQSLLKAHCQACTCPHALSLMPHLLEATPVVKAEPAEDPAQKGFGSSSEASRASESSWQHECGEVVSSPGGGGCIDGQAFTSPCQPCGYPSTPFSAASSSSSSYHPEDHRLNISTTSTMASNSSVSGSAELPTTSPLGPGGRPVYTSGSSLTALVPAVPYSPAQCAQGSPAPSRAPGVPSARSVLDELVCMPGGLRSCVFQEEAATPLSADGRRSISSVSSDVSAMSEQVGGDVIRGPGDEVADLPVGDFYVRDDVSSSSDVSQLLSQINQSDLIFQQDGMNLDEVFSDSVNLPENFLHSL